MSALRPNAPSVIVALAGALAGCGGTVETSAGAGAAAGSTGTGIAGAGGAPTTGSGTTTGPGTPACKPGDPAMKIASAKPGTMALAIDADFVYFWAGAGLTCTKSGAVSRVPKAGGPAEVLWDTVQVVAAIAADGERVYWTDDPADKCTLPDDPGYMLYAGAKDGGKPSVLPVSQPFQAAIAMTVDEQQVYWAWGGQPIFSASLDGSGSGFHMQPGDPPSDVAVDDSRIYILGATHIYSSPKVPMQPPELVFDISSAVLRGLALDADRLYFGGWGPCEGKECAYETETIRALAKEMGSKDVTLSSRPDRRTVRMAADGEHVYWTERNSPQAPAGGAVMRVSVQGGEVTQIAQVEEPSDIAVDGVCVYWAEGSGEIWRAPK